MSPKPSTQELKIQALKPYCPEEMTRVTPQDRDELVAVLRYYFEECRKNNRLPTFTGIARNLGVTRHQLLSASHEDPQLRNIIQHAKQTVIEYVEEMLLAGRPPIGLIFWLKNNDNWIDKTEVSHNDKTMAEILRELETQGTLINASNPLSDRLKQDALTGDITNQ
jgi:hypothetical protein